MPRVCARLPAKGKSGKCPRAGGTRIIWVEYVGAGYMVLLRGRISFGGHVCSAQPVLLSGLCAKADSKLIVLFSLSGRGEIQVDSTSILASTICEYNFGERMDSWGFL